MTVKTWSWRHWLTRKSSRFGDWHQETIMRRQMRTSYEFPNCLGVNLSYFILCFLALEILSKFRTSCNMTEIEMFITHCFRCHSILLHLMHRIAFNHDLSIPALSHWLQPAGPSNISTVLLSILIVLSIVSYMYCVHVCLLFATFVLLFWVSFFLLFRLFFSRSFRWNFRHGRLACIYTIYVFSLRKGSPCSVKIYISR